MPFWVDISGRESDLFEEYADAVAALNEASDELEASGWTVDRSWASGDNYLAHVAYKPSHHGGGTVNTVKLAIMKDTEDDTEDS